MANDMHNEKLDIAASTTRDGIDAPSMTEADRARLLRKIDFRLVPILFIIYMMAFLDRANIANALTLGMIEELHLTGQQPNIALAIFFIPYITLELLSNMALKRVTPHIWLSLCILGFGTVMICQGFVTNLSGLIATRFFLGVFESGIFPGSFYLLSFWYQRQEAQKRFTVYWASTIIASAFSGLLASAIAKMDGIGDKSSWRWIFILEGILTVLVAVAAFFLVSDFPEQASWLSCTERDFVLHKTGRLGKQQSSKDRDKLPRLRDIGAFLREPQHHLGAIMFFCATVPAYAFAYFTPSIIKTLQYSTVKTQLLSVPPFAAALLVCLVQAYLVDRTNLRFPHLLFSGSLLVSGSVILITKNGHFSAQYVGICFACSGCFTVGALVVCWYLMNLHGHKQRSMGSAWIIGLGNTSGIITPFAFLPRYAPQYRAGYWLCLSAGILGIVAASSYALDVIRRRRKMQADEAHLEPSGSGGLRPPVPSL